MHVVVYRLVMQYTMRDVSNHRLSPDIATELFREVGYAAGREY